MSRPTLSGRTRALLVRASAGLQDRPVRIVILGALLIAAVASHLVFADPRLGFVTVPVLFFAGLAGGRRSPVVFAVLAVLAHLAVDVVNGFTATEVPGVLIRSAVFAGVALAGMAGQYTERQRGEALHRAVVEDPITGLLNVRAFYEELAGLKNAGEPFTVVLADIRGMRGLNERYGHPTGTEAMRALAHVLRRETGPRTLASRLGSDEVAVALVGDDRDGIRTMIDGIIRRLHDEQVTLPDGERFEVHAAYGIARFPEDGDTVVGLLRAADHAKERAKQRGMDLAGMADGEVF